MIIIGGCQFRKTATEGSLWRCLQCGWVLKVKREEPPSRGCPVLQSPEAKAAVEEAKAAAEHAAKHGPGAQLHRLIEKWTGEGITAGCKCARRIAEMNQRGPAWCRENVETIVDWLLEEVQRRLDEAAKDGKPAPWRVRLGGKDLPGRRYVLRKLVIKAVRRAEKASADAPDFV